MKKILKNCLFFLRRTRRRQMNLSGDHQPPQLESQSVVTSQSSSSSQYLSSRYFESPLTAVTSAMLHISGSSQSQADEDSNNNNNNNNLANNINLNALQSNITHQIHQVHNGNGTTYEYYKIADKDGLQWTR
jgi:hypothetical protein